MPKHKPPLKKTHYKFFDKPEYRQDNHDQNVTVNVTVNEKDDAVADCFKALFSCGKKAIS